MEPDRFALNGGQGVLYFCPGYFCHPLREKRTLFLREPQDALCEGTPAAGATPLRNSPLRPARGVSGICDYAGLTPL